MEIDTSDSCRGWEELNVVIIVLRDESHSACSVSTGALQLLPVNNTHSSVLSPFVTIAMERKGNMAPVYNRC